LKICKHKDEDGDCICAETWRQENKTKLKAYYKAWAKINRPRKNEQKPPNQHYLKYKDKYREYYLKKKAEKQLLMESKPKKQLSKWLMGSK